MKPETYLTLNKAAELCGRSKGTISKAIKKGALSIVSKENGVFQIDPAEVLRVFPIKRVSNGYIDQKETHKMNVRNDLETHVKMIELKTKLESEIKEKEIYKEQVLSLEKDRNDWKEQANKLLLSTSLRPIKKTPSNTILTLLALIFGMITGLIIYMTQNFWLS